MSRPLSAAILACPALALASALAGCESEPVVVRQRTMLDGLEGAVRSDGSAADSVAVPKGSSLETVSDDRLVVKSPIGEVRIISQSPRHVLLHTRRLLSGGLKGVEGAEGKEEQIFFEQLLATATKRRLVSEGHDPQVAMDYLTANRADVVAFVTAMPNGELSTDVIMEQTSADVWRLTFRGGLRRRALRFEQLWVTREGNAFKFLWIN